MSVRFLIINASLTAILAVIAAFLTGPLWGLRLDYEKGQNIQLIQLAIPTFLGYLSSAVTYATVGEIFPEPRGERGKMLRVISIGGLLLFAIGFVLSTTMYYLSAAGKLTTGRLDYNQYTQIVTLLLGLLTVTTSAVATFVFARRKESKS